MFKLKKAQISALFFTFLAPAVFSSELAMLEFPRTSYAITYTNSDSIAISCSRVNTCVVNALVNGRKFTFTPAELKVRTIDPYHAQLRTPGSEKDDRENNFSIYISTSCKTTAQDKDYSCYTSADIKNGKIESAYTETTKTE